MDNEGGVSPSPKKMYVRNPNPRPIDGILIHKLPVNGGWSTVLASATHDSSNQMNTENTVLDLALLSEEK